ncbi:MAG: inositol monophosphatase family protein [Elusimicrobiota bacterium]
MTFNKYTKTAIRAAKKAGEVLLKYYKTNLKVDYKGIINPVTEADRSSQRAIIELIRKEFPGHTFVGEEDEKKHVCDEYCWIIDPLDGTVNFIHHIPLFSISIGLSHNGKIIAGVVYAPFLGEMYVAEKGKGAFVNGKRIKVSNINRMVRSVVITGFSYDIHKDTENVLKRLGRILKSVEGVRRLGSAAIDLAYVACGRAEAFWEEGLCPWDVAAGSLLVEEAGGKVTDFDNGDNYIYGRSLVATNGIVHKHVIGLLKKGE